jgi:carbon monoxide dehydrogenase subunit G
MHFEGEFRVPGKAADVMQRFADVPRMARCMPGAMLEPQAEDGSWPGAMVVSFGPKRINFKGRATCDFDRQALTGSVNGRGTADMRSARIGVKVAFTLSDVAGGPAPETVVKIVSDAELGGVLEDFARTGGIAVANAIMEDFARRAGEEFAKDAPPPAAVTAPRSAGTEPPQQQAPLVQNAPLVAHGLIGVVLKAYWLRFLRALGLAR